MRHHFSENQVIPSWTGFNITMHGNLAVLKSSVNYLDCIDSPATEPFITPQLGFQDFSGIPQLRKHPQNLSLER